MLAQFTRSPRGFTRVPNALIRARDIAVGPKMVIVYLLSFDWGTNGCYVGQRRIAADLAVDIRTVRRHLKYLSARGLISVKRGPTPSRTTYLVNLSCFNADKNAPSAQDDSGQIARNEADTDAPRGRAQMQPVVTRVEEDSPTTASAGELSQHDEIKQTLSEAGINEPARSELARLYSPEAIRNQVEWMRYRSVRDASGALVAALREDWAEPPVAREQRLLAEKLQLQLTRAAAAERLVDSAVVTEEARIESRRMEARTRYAFWDRASEELGGRSALERYGRDRYDVMVAKYALHLIGESLRDRAS